MSGGISNGTMKEQAGDVVVEVEDPEPGKYTVQAGEPVGDRQKIGQGQAESREASR